MSYVGETLSNLLHQTAFFNLTWGNYVMILVAFIFLYLAIKKGFEPLLLVPIAFGMLLVNIYPDIIASPEQTSNGVGGLLYYFYTLDEWSILPSLIFMGVGAMTDFGPLIANPVSFLMGAAAQFGIFSAYFLALILGFNDKAAAAVSIIGGADGPTSIFLAGKLGQTGLMGPIAVAAYSYMALVPIIQPPIMKLFTTKKERAIKMQNLRPVSKLEKILFPIVVTVVVCVLLPTTAPLVGMLMLGNLFRESGVVRQLQETASNALMYIVVILLGTSVGATTSAEAFLNASTLKIVVLGLVAFMVGTAAGVLFGKLLCWITKGKINPLIGSAGVSAVPMAARVSQKVGAEEDPTNFLLMHAMGPNVAGVIGPAVAAGCFMSEVVKKPLKITETVLRDAHQSLIATRMTTEQMLPIIPKMDKVGFNAVECWGGATFDACLRFLKEDPWDRLRKLRDGFKNTKLQMLFRGQNILGYRPYADDVVEYFVQKSIANGIDIIRIFDCLNDIRNLQTAVTACNKEKGHAQVALSYTLGDAYTLDYWMEMAKRVEDMGADSLCIKDMAGLLVPAKATELVQALKDSTSLPVELHTHYTSGVASMTYMKAVEAGVDIIDTAMSPFALGTSQPATEVMVEAFKDTPYDTGLDLNLLSEIADYFRPLREEALASGLMNPKVLGVNINTLRYQVPGGMLSNLISQLKEQGKEDKYEEVLAEVPRVRKDLGEPPLVTPSSQIVGTQAVFNVLMGERYKVATKETKDILLGKYGQTVKPFNPEVVDKVLGEDKKNAITCRPADLLEPELGKIEAEMKQYKQQDEDVLSYALFPQVATDFFKYREAQQTGVDAKTADTKNGAYPV